MEVSFKDGKIVESQVVKSIKVLKSLSRAQAIFALTEFLAGLKSVMREHTMYIETTIPLSPAQLKRMKAVIEKRVKITKIVTNINPQILGGFKLRVGDDIYDESVLGKINQIKEVITSGRSNSSN